MPSVRLCLLRRFIVQWESRIGDADGDISTACCQIADAFNNRTDQYYDTTPMARFKLSPEDTDAVDFGVGLYPKQVSGNFYLAK